MELYKRLLGAVSVTLLLSSTGLSAKEQSAKEILDNAFKYIQNMDKYAFKAVVVDHEQEEDGSIKNYRLMSKDLPEIEAIISITVSIR